MLKQYEHILLGGLMYNLADIKTVKSILSRYGFNFSKSLGQNFLINPSVCPRMAEECGCNMEVGVIEIGPGIGVLTCELAKRTNKVVAIELDKKLLPILSETLSDFDNIKIINDDIMKMNLEGLIASEFDGKDVVVCANLPYYITSPIIMKLLETRLNVKSITVMVQKEVALRLCTDLGTRDSSSIGVAINYYAEPELLFEVSRGNFVPMPKVDSAVIKLNIRKEPQFKVQDEKLFFKVVNAAFSQRRKTLHNSLSNGLNLQKSIVQDILNGLSIPLTIRAENLNIEQFVKISNYIYDRKIKL